MPIPELLAALSAADAAALAAIVVAWLGLGWRIELEGARRPSVTVMMDAHRRAWMRVFAARDMKIFDATILNGLRDGAAFFASTALLAIGGAFALIGDPSPLVRAASELTAEAASASLWRLKLLLPALFLGLAFLRFVWAHRVFGYSAVAMGAMPEPAARDCPQVAMAAELNVRAARNFNRGLRALYFALAALGWLAGAVGLAVATALVAWMIWTREFSSAPRALLDAGGAPHGGPTPADTEKRP